MEIGLDMKVTLTLACTVWTDLQLPHPPSV